jgi:hypothetical protein
MQLSKARLTGAVHLLDILFLFRHKLSQKVLRKPSQAFLTPFLFCARCLNDVSSSVLSKYKERFWKRRVVSPSLPADVPMNGWFTKECGVLGTISGMKGFAASSPSDANES